MVLNWNALQNAAIHETPYRWIQFENLIQEDVQSELIQTFPAAEQFVELGEGDDWLWKSAIAHEKVIARMAEIDPVWRSHAETGKITSSIQDLSEIWQELIQELWTPAYQEIMEKLSGLNLKNHGMTVIFRRQHSKHTKFWLPHTDGQYTHVSHLFYFHEQWLKDWGGCFCVLSDDQPESVVHEIHPMINNSVAIVRSDNSWHMVTPVSPLVTHHRLTMKTVFWATP